MNLITRTHLEAKAAETLRTQNLDYGKLYVPLEPCLGARGCDTLLPFMLPEHCQLEVEGPHGFHKIYFGIGSAPDSVIPDAVQSTTWTFRSKAEENIIVPNLVDLESLVDNAVNSSGRRAFPIVELISPSLGSVAMGLGPDSGFLNFLGPDGLNSSASSIGDSTRSGQMRFSYLGYPSDIPVRNLIAISRARKGLLHFFLSGKLTEEIQWENDSSNDV
jgi:hypothetical protein